MDLLSVIRRWHFRQEISIREIKRRTGLSRNTIRKYLRSDAVEPSFKVPVRPSKLDPFAEKLTAWLRVESKKPRKQKRTAKQLYADLVKLGYDGSYNRVAAFARRWRTELQYEQQTSGRGTFVPLVFQPGEAGSVMIFVCGRAVEHYVAMARMKRSPKITANCAFAMVHSRGGIFHSFSDRFKMR